MRGSIGLGTVGVAALILSASPPPSVSAGSD